MKFLGNPLEIPAALNNTQAVRKIYVDAGDTALGDRITALENGGASGSGLGTKTVSAAYTAEISEFVLADATATAFTVTLPDNPPADTIVAVKKIDNSTNMVTVAPTAPATIDGDLAVYLPSPQTAAQFVYDGTVWRVSSVAVYDTGTVPHFTYRGDYDPAVGYLVKDVVYFQGNSYIAKIATTGNAPTVDASDARWGLLALHGAAGAGGADGAVFVAILNKIGSYTAATGDYVLANASSAAFTITLPTNPPVGSLVGVKKVDPSFNEVTVVGGGAATIDGDPSCVLTSPWTGVTFLYTGINWVIQSTTIYG